MYTDSDSTIFTWRGTTCAHFHAVRFFVYTLHFHAGLPHGKQADTRHYTGIAGDLDARLDRHKAGNGARLMSIVAERGIGWELAQLIECATYSEAHELEQRLKKHSATRRCPVCAGKPKDVLTAMREGHYPLASHVGPRRPMPAARNEVLR